MLQVYFDNHVIRISFYNFLANKLFEQTTHTYEELRVRDFRISLEHFAECAVLNVCLRSAKLQENSLVVLIYGIATRVIIS